VKSDIIFSGDEIMMGLGGQELWIVLIIVMVLFGGSKVPQLMKGIGEGIRELRKGAEYDPETQKTGI